MVTSLDTAIKECEQAIMMLGVVHDPVEYRKLDKLNQRTTVNGLAMYQKTMRVISSTVIGSAFKTWKKQLAPQKIKKC